jgi:hypothetical protein
MAPPRRRDRGQAVQSARARRRERGGARIHKQTHTQRARYSLAGGPGCLGCVGGFLAPGPPEGGGGVCDEAAGGGDCCCRGRGACCGGVCASLEAWLLLPVRGGGGGGGGGEVDLREARNAPAGGLPGAGAGGPCDLGGGCGGGEEKEGEGEEGEGEGEEGVEEGGGLAVASPPSPSSALAPPCSCRKNSPSLPSSGAAPPSAASGCAPSAREAAVSAAPRRVAPRHAARRRRSPAAKRPWGGDSSNVRPVASPARYARPRCQ